MTPNIKRTVTIQGRDAVHTVNFYSDEMTRENYDAFIEPRRKELTFWRPENTMWNCFKSEASAHRWVGRMVRQYGWRNPTTFEIWPLTDGRVYLVSTSRIS